MNILTEIRKYRWDLAFALKSEGHRWDSKDWILHVVKNPYKERWFADPFILEIDDKFIYVLVEEFEYKRNKGRIAKLVIDKEKYIIKSYKILLDLETHLSFPAIIKYNNNIYIYPENSESGKLTLYSYNRELEILEPVQLLCNEPLTDAIIVTLDKKKIILSTTIPNQNGDSLSIYLWNDKSSIYSLHQVIKFDENIARGAGFVFEDKNMFIRPAQNCNNAYGFGLVFQNIEFINDKLVINELSRHEAPKGYLGMHTYNQYEDYVVVDLRRYCHRTLYRIFKYVKQMLKK